MLLNKKTRDYFKPDQAEEIEAVREQILKLTKEEQDLISKGESTIDGHIRFGRTKGGEEPSNVIGLIVFNLNEDIPGNVMKYLAMLYTAAGFRKVSIGCECFSSESGINQVKYPNVISFQSVD